MKSLGFLYVAILGIFFSGCATLIDGSNQKVLLMASDRQNVVATIGKEKVQLPAEVELPRKGVLITVLAKDNQGYKDSKVHSSTIGAMINNPKFSFNTMFCALIVPCPIGIVFSSIDIASGAAYKYSNEQLIIPVYPQTCRIK